MNRFLALVVAAIALPLLGVTQAAGVTVNPCTVGGPPNGLSRGGSTNQSHLYLTLVVRNANPWPAVAGVAVVGTAPNGEPRLFVAGDHQLPSRGNDNPDRETNLINLPKTNDYPDHGFHCTLYRVSRNGTVVWQDAAAIATLKAMPGPGSIPKSTP